MLPILLLGGAAAATIAYFATRDDGPATKRKGAPPPPSASCYLPKSERGEAVKAKIVELKRKAEQGDKDAGKLLADLKATWGNLTR